MKRSISITEPHRELLHLESALAADAIGNGLTSIRNYDFANKGRFFGAMLSLTIGLERVLKMAYLLSEFEDLGRFPEPKVMKNKFNHNIGLLMDTARSINEGKGLGVDTAKVDDALCHKIVEFMTRFADFSRYYNIEHITGATKLTDEEPLAMWDREVVREILRRHHRTSKRQELNIVFAELMSSRGGLVVDHTLEDGTAVNDFVTLTLASNLVPVKQKYSLYYILVIVEFAVEVLTELDFRQSPQLFIYEFFRHFHTMDKRGVLRRKRWSSHV